MGSPCRKVVSISFFRQLRAGGGARGWGRGSSSGDPQLPSQQLRLRRRAPLPRCSPRSRPRSWVSRSPWAGRGGGQSRPCAGSPDTRRAEAGPSGRPRGPVSIRALGLAQVPGAAARPRPCPRPASLPEARRGRPPSVLGARTLRLRPGPA